MGDKINFPHNERMFFEQAKQFYADKELTKAHEAIKKVYESNKNLDVSHLHVVISYALEEYEEAMEIAETNKDFYMNDDKLILTYVMLLIKTKRYVEAEAIIQRHVKQTSSSDYDLWLVAKKELDNGREQARIETAKQKSEVKHSLLHIENVPLSEQNTIIQLSESLDLADLQEIAPKIFKSPYLNGMVQRAFFELLVKKMDPDEYVFPWFNQRRTVRPIECTVFEQNPILKQIQIVLEEKLQNHPSLYEPIYTEILDDLLLLYPFMEDVVTDADYWVDCYLDALGYADELNVAVEPQTDEQKELNGWFHKLNEISQRNF